MSSDTELSSTTDDTAETHGADDLHHHEISDKTYVLIALLLAVLTAMEVAVTEISSVPDGLLIPALLIMMVIKFFIVVIFGRRISFLLLFIYPRRKDLKILYIQIRP